MNKIERLKKILLEIKKTIDNKLEADDKTKKEEEIKNEIKEKIKKEIQKLTKGDQAEVNEYVLENLNPAILSSNIEKIIPKLEIITLHNFFYICRISLIVCSYSMFIFLLFLKILFSPE